MDEKIALAIDMCEGKPKFKYYKIYPFTNENINAYIKYFDVANKSLFTVGSSLDQALNAIYEGSKNIMLFDICPFSKEYYYLKKAAIQTLSKNEFLKFFCYRDYPNPFWKNQNAFSEKLYRKVKEYLLNDDFESYCFWQELYKKYKGLQIRQDLFTRDEYNYNLVQMMNNYLKSDTNYMAMRKKLSDAQVKFLNGDIFDANITGQYDNIWLSNLGTCYSMESAKDLFNKMCELLNDNGKMLVSYLYDISEENDYMPGEHEIYDLPFSLKKFDEACELHMFIGHNGLLFNSERMKDGIITYKKVKKM